MATRKGLVQTPSAQQPKSTLQITHNVAGRQVKTRTEASRIIQPNAQPEHVSRPILTGSESIKRGLLVDGSGRPLRGLSQTTINAKAESDGQETELCTRCGEMRTKSEMTTIIPNAEQPNNPLRICNVVCTKMAYKNPHNTGDQWRPQVPNTRFDRKTGQAYDARRAGVTIKDLVTKDTYHKENEAPAEIRQQTDVVGRGTWSGGGKVGHTVKPRR